jgi:TPR repeat protein
MPRGVNHPLFVPSSLADVRRLIECRRSNEAVALLKVKAKFANHPAAALLAFIHFKGAAPQEEYAAAVTQCMAAAAAADPFAEYVLAQIHLTAGNTLEGLAWMRKSSNHLFPPALSHMGRMMARGEGLFESAQ